MPKNLLSSIYYPSIYAEEQLPQLAKELRDFIIDIVSARRTSWC
jgi:deoxyxylulose-5-phosphate synthase